MTGENLKSVPMKLLGDAEEPERLRVTPKLSNADASDDVVPLYVVGRPLCMAGEVACDGLLETVDVPLGDE